MYEMAAALLVSNFDGEVPVDKKDLLSLPGVSDYIANAVRRSARKEADALIDTNTVRITGRLFSIEKKTLPVETENPVV